MRPKKPAGAERHRRSAGDLFRARLDQIIDMGHELVRLSKAMRIRHQRQNRRGRKLYSWHAPETECIGKGKAHRPYEFGVKVLIVTTNRRAKGGRFVLHAKALPGKAANRARLIGMSGHRSRSA